MLKKGLKLHCDESCLFFYISQNCLALLGPLS